MSTCINDILNHILSTVLLIPSLDVAVIRRRSAGLDSFMRQLLSVDCLQPAVAHLLLIRLSDYMDSTSASKWVFSPPIVCSYHTVVNYIISSLFHHCSPTVL